MNELTAQGIFDKVATHLFTQGKQALNASGKCMYRGMDNTTCAIGCLIPDEKYEANFENKGVNSSTLELAFPEFKPFDELLSDLQTVHDDGDFYNRETHSYTKKAGWKSTENMKEVLTSVANKHKLSVSVLDTLKFKDR